MAASACIDDYLWQSDAFLTLSVTSLIVWMSVQTTVASHDTTGGMATKVAEAASIAAMGIDVYIVEVVYLTLCLFSFFLREVCLNASYRCGFL